MKTTLIYFMVIASLMLGGIINSITPKAIAYEAQPKSFPIIIEIRKTWTDDKIKEEIKKNLPAVFVRIAGCESTGDPAKMNVMAYNKKTDDRGLLQVNDHYWKEWYESENLDPYNVEDAITIAKHIYKVQGLSAWDASRRCWSQ